MEKKKKASARQKHREAVLAKAGPSVVSAVNRLAIQVDSENDSVAQRAAKELIDLFAQDVMQEDDREIVVRIEGLPEIGMPEEPGEAGA